MPRTIVPPPHLSAQMVKEDRLPDAQWYGWFSLLYAALNNRLPVTGSVTFTAETLHAVTFTTPEADALYDVWFAPVDNKIYWATSKTTTGFDARASAAETATLRYMIIRA